MNLPRIFLAAALLSSLGPALAADDLPVRKDRTRDGWFIVGVTPAYGQNVPVDVELRVGSPGAARKAFRSPDPRYVNLCTVLVAAGAAGRPADLYLTFRRGRATFDFSIPYDGAFCGQQGREVAATSRGTGGRLPPLNLLTPEPGPAAVDVATAGGPAPASSGKPCGTGSLSAGDYVPCEGAQEPARPTPVPKPMIAVAPAPAPAPKESGENPGLQVLGKTRPAPTPEAPTPPEPPDPGRTAESRGITKQGFAGFRVLLSKSKRLKTNDYVIELQFREPVDVDGLESAIVVSAETSVRRPREAFLDAGQDYLLEDVPNARATRSVSFRVPMGLAIETPGVGHRVFLKVKLADVVLEGDTGVQRGSAD